MASIIFHEKTNSNTIVLKTSSVQVACYNGNRAGFVLSSGVILRITFESGVAFTQISHLIDNDLEAKGPFTISQYSWEK
jgi:hypothetical protein